MTVMPEAFFDYLDYIELKEARNDSKAARKEAIQAQLTAVAALAITIVIGIIQIVISLNTGVR